MIEPVTGVTRRTVTSLPAVPRIMVAHTDTTALGPSVTLYDILDRPTMITAIPNRKMIIQQNKDMQLMY